MALSLMSGATSEALLAATLRTAGDEGRRRLMLDGGGFNELVTVSANDHPGD